MKNSRDIYTKRINTVIDYVNKNLHKSISLEELAAVSFFSPYHFHRVFMAVTGESVHNFTTRARLEKSTKLLKFSKNKVSQIAYECGFSSVATFSRTFKKYFEISPSSFRKTQVIKNSKIRKDLFPLSQYHCSMSEEEMRNSFPVLIKDFPERRIAFIRVLDSFKDGVVIAHFADLVEWAKKEGIYDSAIFFGMSKDDPLVTPQDKYVYEVCMTLPNNYTMKSEARIESKIVAKCKYAVASVSGDFNKVATAINYLFNHWFINSDYEPEHQAGLEIFNDKKSICNWESFDLDLCIPIKEIKYL